jgi:glycosidase
MRSIKSHLWAASVAAWALCGALGLSACVGSSEEAGEAPAPDLPDDRQGAAPRFGALPALEVEPGQGATLALGALVSDEDHAVGALRFSALAAGPLEATLEGDALTVRAPAGFEGFGSVALRVVDPGGLFDVADLRVKVGDPPLPPEDMGADVVEDADELDLPPADVGPDQPPGDMGEGDQGGDPDAVDPPDEGPGDVEAPDLPDEPGDPAPRDCRTVFSYDAGRHGADFGALWVAGEFNNFTPGMAALRDEDQDGVWTAAVALAPGDYGYKLVKDDGQREGAWILDPGNPHLKTVGCCDNSRVLVPPCEGPALRVVAAVADPARRSLSFTLQVEDSPQDAGVDWESLSLRLNERALRPEEIQIVGDRVQVEVRGLEMPNRYTLRGSLQDRQGRASEALYAPIWLEAEPFQWEDAVLYFAFTDRFHNGDPSNDAPAQGVDALANWSGGDFRGIQQRIEEGYFDRLGVNALWISAPNDNPDRRDQGADGRWYASYHGYFPSSWRAPENHFGSLEDMRAMVAAAHERGIRVLVDWVGNHVHETHPWRAEEPDWFNGPGLCRDNDGWNVRPETCWFESYLPDLRYEVTGVSEAVAEHGAWWSREADLDGFRVDAVKHMPHNFGYTLRAYVDQAQRDASLPFYMVGETFTGTWSQETGDLLRAYVNPAELNGQFDFPVYWELLRAVARREGSFRDLDGVVRASEGFYGPDAIMSTFLGNHDVPRFVSHAWQPPFDMWGNGGRDIGWDPGRRPQQPAEAQPYRRLEQAFTFLMTMPGVPLIYYGDEVGLAGAGDPDNRRPMPSDQSLNEHQRRLRGHVERLGALRRESRALRRGARQTLLAEDNWYAWVRSAGSEAALVILSRDGGQVTVRAPAPFAEGETLRDALSDRTATVQGGNVTLELPADGGAVLVRP